MEQKTNRRRLLSSGVLVLLTAIGMVVTLASRNEGILTAFGAENFKLFTVDSNLLLGFVCAAELISAAVGGDRSERFSLWLDRLFYIATVAVALTFTVVCVIFGPMVGYAPLFRDGNLYSLLFPPLSFQ